MELTKLIKKGESETLEFKPSLSQKDNICKAVSAFSNTKGGTILIGVSDGGRVSGLDVGRKTLEDLAGYVKGNTDPSIFPSIKQIEINNNKIIAITVEESKEKPVFFKDKAYKRVGKSTHRISASEIIKLAKESGEKVYWDEQVCEGVTLGDIDWRFVKEFFIPRYETVTGTKVVSEPENLLEKLECIKNRKPTNAGILLFGKNPQQFFRNAYIALARYKKGIGTERFDYKEFDENILQQIDNCDGYIKEHMALMSRQHPMKVEREDIPEYPLFSVRELVTNAVCHRDYAEQRTKIIIKMFDDSIEFYNPGGLIEDITAENIAEKQYSRNPIIAKVLSKIRYIEELGEGWNKILKEHKNHPLKPKRPRISADRSSMLVALFSTKEKFEEKKESLILNERQKYIIETIRSQGFIKSMDIQKKFDVTRDTANRDLNHLIKLKLIKRQGMGKSITYTQK